MSELALGPACEVPEAVPSTSLRGPHIGMTFPRHLGSSCYLLAAGPRRVKCSSSPPLPSVVLAGRAGEDPRPRARTEAQPGNQSCRCLGSASGLLSAFPPLLAEPSLPAPRHRGEKA